MPKCHNYKQLFECQLSIIIVNCFHVFVNEIPTLRAYTGLLHLRGASDSVMVYVHIMLIFHGNIHGNNLNKMHNFLVVFGLYHSPEDCLHGV